MNIVKLTKQEWLLLLYLAAREQGLIARTSARHADVLYFLGDDELPAVAKQLVEKELVTEDGTEWKVTVRGRHRLQIG